MLASGNPFPRDIRRVNRICGQPLDSGILTLLSESYAPGSRSRSLDVGLGAIIESHSESSNEGNKKSDVSLVSLRD